VIHDKSYKDNKLSYQVVKFSIVFKPHIYVIFLIILHTYITVGFDLTLVRRGTIEDGTETWTEMLHTFLRKPRLHEPDGGGDESHHTNTLSR